jgi:hypothetical protein
MQSSAFEVNAKATREGYSEFALIAWEKNGKGPPVTCIGRDVVYSINSVEKWLKQQEQASRPQSTTSTARSSRKELGIEPSAAPSCRYFDRLESSSFAILRNSSHARRHYFPFPFSLLFRD